MPLDTPQATRAEHSRRQPLTTKHCGTALDRAPERPLELTRDPAFVSGTNDIFDVLARIMTQAAQQTIESQQHRLKTLEDLSGIDSLTGLLNERGFIKLFTREIARTNRGFNAGGLLVIFNLENYKTIETRHGTEASAQALILLAKTLEQEIREMDSAARMQDDEFILLFTDTSMENALERLQKMALRLNKISMIWDNQTIRLNLSLGLKSYGKGSHPDQIFKSASDDLQRNRRTSEELKTAQKMA